MLVLRRMLLRNSVKCNVSSELDVHLSMCTAMSMLSFVELCDLAKLLALPVRFWISVALRTR